MNNKRHPVVVFSAMGGIGLVIFGGAMALLQAYGKLPAPVDIGPVVVYVLCVLILFIFGGLITFRRIHNRA